MSNIKKIYTCSYCSKTFSKPSALRPHVYTHTGEKPYICHVDGCGRQFSVVSNLRRHFKLHTAAANKSALSTRQQQQRKTQHPAIRVPQRQVTRTSPPPMPRRLLPAIQSSSLMMPTPPMINVIEPSTDDIATTTTAMTPPPPSALSFNHDENGHMPMWMNPYMMNYSFNSHPFINNCHDNTEGSNLDTTISVPSPPPTCSTNSFTFQFSMDTTTESPVATFYVTDYSSNSRTMVNSHMCPSFFQSHHGYT